MKIISAIIISSVIFFSSGCDFPDGVKKAQKVVNTLDEAMITAEPIVSLLEREIPGWDGMSEEKKVKIINTMLNVESGTEKISGIARAIGAVIPSSRPYTDGVANIALLIGTLAGSLMAFIKNRKAKKLEAVAVSQMKAGEQIRDFGKIAKSASSIAGVSVEAEKLYQKHIIGNA